MNFSKRLYLILGAVLFSMAGASIISLAVLNQSIVSSERSMTALISAEREVARIQVNFKTQVQEWKNVLLRGKNTDQREKYWTSFQQRESAVSQASRDLLDNLPRGSARDKLGDFITQHEAMSRGYRAGLEAFRKSGFESAAGDKAVSGMDRGPTKTIHDVEKTVASQAAEGAAASAAQRSKITLISFAILLIVGAFGILASILITRSIIKEFGGEPDDVRKVAGDISKGHLATTIHLRKNDKKSVLASISAMRDSLVTLVEKVSVSSDAISIESNAVATGSDELAQRREEQFKALADSSSSIKQLGTAVQNNAEHARQANELACGSSAVASKGREVVSNVVATMSEINQSSKQISDIISVIDGIAFQTNLLALNAAVEAARAGEQGRGFAVVATEVRSLAQRSSSAADEIKALITDSVARVEQGSTYVDQAGSTMDDIVASIEKMTEMMGEITRASSEQNDGVSQVEQSISIIDDLTTKNGLVVQDNVNSASNLNKTSQELVDVVSVFNLGENSRAA